MFKFFALKVNDTVTYINTSLKPCVNNVVVSFMPYQRIITFFISPQSSCSRSAAGPREEIICISNSYTMGCPPVRGDNPQALASGLSYVQVDKNGITILCHLHQCRPCTSSDIPC